MRSKERVRRAVEFRDPDRVPICGTVFGDVFYLIQFPPRSWQPPAGYYPHVDPLARTLLQWRWKPERKFVVDADGTRHRWPPKHWRDHPREEVDEWGCYWDQVPDIASMGHPGRPALETWDDLADWEPPDYSNPWRYRFFGILSKFLHRYTMCSPDEAAGLFQRATNLRGFTNFMVDLRRHPKQVHELLKRINEAYLERLEMWLKYKPDAVFVLDDLGTQQDVFVSPALFRKFFKDPMREQIQWAHDHGLHYILHSCGRINAYIPDFIEWGVDALEFDSPRMVGGPTLDEYESYRGKICFWGCVDIQQVYPSGTPADITTEVKRMMKKMGTEYGGFVAYRYWGAPTALDVPKKNHRAMRRAVRKWGKYPLTWDCPDP